MRHRIRSVISALAVLVFATAGVLSVHAEVLCVGTDGHIGFEGPAMSDDCHGGPVESHSPHETVATLGMEEECCTDFALPGRTAFKAKDLQNALATPPLFVVWAHFENFPSEATFPVLAPAFNIGAITARTLTSHQTAILLI